MPSIAPMNSSSRREEPPDRIVVRQVVARIEDHQQADHEDQQREQQPRPSSRSERSMRRLQPGLADQQRLAGEHRGRLRQQQRQRRGRHRRGRPGARIASPTYEQQRQQRAEQGQGNDECQHHGSVDMLCGCRPGNYTGIGRLGTPCTGCLRKPNGDEPHAFRGFRVLASLRGASELRAVTAHAKVVSSRSGRFGPVNAGDGDCRPESAHRAEIPRTPPASIRRC